MGHGNTFIVLSQSSHGSAELENPHLCLLEKPGSHNRVTDSFVFPRDRQVIKLCFAFSPAWQVLACSGGSTNRLPGLEILPEESSGPRGLQTNCSGGRPAKTWYVFAVRSLLPSLWGHPSACVLIAVPTSCCVVRGWASIWRGCWAFVPYPVNAAVICLDPPTQVLFKRAGKIAVCWWS